MAQWVKNLPAMQETQEMKLQSLGWEEPLEEDTAAHSSIPAWKIPWTEEPGGLPSKGSQRVQHEWATKHTHTRTHTHKHVEYNKLEIIKKDNLQPQVFGS